MLIDMNSINLNVIEVELKAAGWGRMAYFPANKPAEFVTKLTGTKTLTDNDLSLLKNLGLTVHEVVVRYVGKEETRAFVRQL